MALASFPTLPGIGNAVKRTQLWSTTVQEAASGKETALSWWSYPRWKWDIPVEALRQYGLFTELAALAGFYGQHWGRGDVWLYREPSDCAVTGQLVGIGDDATASFQLVRAFGGEGGFVEPVWVATVSAAYVDGVAVGGWSVSAWGGDAPPGVLTLGGPPAGGARVTADFSYGFVCRFQDDQFDFERQWEGCYAAPSLKFYSVK